MLLQSVMATSVGPNRVCVSGSIGEELEEPFGLSISAYATTIEIRLRSALGETDLPPMPAPVDYVLT